MGVTVGQTYLGEGGRRVFCSQIEKKINYSNVKVDF
jgi:hypothetical protein